jgi:CRP-like cAMP-binding protein
MDAHVVTSSPKVRALGRGGLWVDTPAGPVQFGAPSETIKDTLRDPHGVPRLFVLGKRLFDERRGLSFADVEFPIYFNLFAKQQALRVVCTAEQAERLRGVVSEALLGPEGLMLDRDYAPGTRVPDLGLEIEYFKKGPYSSGRLELSDGLELLVYDGQEVDLGDGVTVRELDDGFSLWWGGREQVRFPADPPLPPDEPERVERHEPFVPPDFGVTTLGRSHGFDPDPSERTSGFVLWVGGRGIMVDPPVRSLDVLRANEIDLGHVQAILLTHCHADHDAGTLERALSGGKISLYTTPTIFASYRRKWSLLSGIPEAELGKLFEFCPVQIGAPTLIEGAQFLFRYTLHAIPTIAFETHYRGRSFNYSSDTLNDPERIDAIFAAGGMERARREELLNFDWSSDLIFHESGVPPLHTQLDVLTSLPKAVRERTVIVHITPSKLGPDTGLRIAETGREGTLAIDVAQSPEQRVVRKLALLSRIRLFADLPLRVAADLLAASTTEEFSAGERFIRQGDEGDKLYVVTAGKARVVRDGEVLKVNGVGDYFGETAVFLGQPRAADIEAVTNVEVLAIDGERMRVICAGTDLEERVRRHAEVRKMDAWSLLEETELFSGLTVAQKNDLEALLRPHRWARGEPVYARSDVARELVIVQEGEVELHGEEERTVARGAVIGEPAAVLARGRYGEAATAKSDVVAFGLVAADLDGFLEWNPGVRVRVQPWSERTVTSSEAASLIDMLEELI